MDTKHYFSEHLLEWYREHRRTLPWRDQNNPYYTWVSEIMLQQTRVDTVIPYFHRFIAQFPTVQALAEAPEEQVLKAWEGLGYYSRARNLQTAAREVQTSYNGQIPNRKEDVLGLKGVGSYTAGAILSIAFNAEEPAVDGNVMRVLSRYFLIQEDITKGKTKNRMEALAQELIPQGHAGDFNQALMELGALVCTPKSPLCLTCPVMEHCSARFEGLEEELPIKKKAKQPRLEHRVTAVVLDTDRAGTSRILVRKRPDQGLLARMWELPHEMLYVPEANWKYSDDEQNMRVLAERIETESGIRVTADKALMEIGHVFSHIKWDMRVYLLQPASVVLSEDTERYRWMEVNEQREYTFPNVFNKILSALEENQLWSKLH